MEMLLTPRGVSVIRWQQRAALCPSLERSLRGTGRWAGRPAELKDQGSVGVRGREGRLGLRTASPTGRRRSRNSTASLEQQKAGKGHVCERNGPDKGPSCSGWPG